MKILFTTLALPLILTSCSLSRGSWECDSWKCSFNTNGEASRDQKEELPTENGGLSPIKESD